MKPGEDPETGTVLVPSRGAEEARYPLEGREHDDVSCERARPLTRASLRESTLKGPASEVPRSTAGDRRASGEQQDRKKSGELEAFGGYPTVDGVRGRVRLAPRRREPRPHLLQTGTCRGRTVGPTREDFASGAARHGSRARTRASCGVWRTLGR